MDGRLQENLSLKQQDYIAPFLWLHGENDELIVKEIDRIHESGIRSICIESRTHEDFAGDGWWSDVELILKECEKRQMHLWILDDKHFPSGYANGIFEEKYKDLQAWGITEAHVDVAGPVNEGSVMCDTWLTSPEDEFVAILACKHVPNSDSLTGEVIDITDGISDGMVYFNLPEGMWRIVFLIKTRSGIASYCRAFCDMLNPKTIDLFIEEVYESHYQHFAPYFGNTLRGFFSDEPGFKNDSAHSNILPTGVAFAHYPWRDGLIDALTNELGEDAKKMLPGIWFSFDNGYTEKIRWAYMDTITKEYKHNFCDKIGGWCRKHGVEYIGHVIEDNNAHAKTNYGTGHYFRALEGQDMSGIDVVLHQILPGLTECSSAGAVSYRHMNQEFFHYYLGKLASSLAHMDPLKKGRAMCEIFGAYGWAEGTKVMKYLMDHMLVRGVNYFVPHAFSPKPHDPDCPPNFYDTGENPEYRYFLHQMNYLNRMCHILSDGVHVPTCAILYDAEAQWINGDYLPLEKVGKALYDNLLDYDIIPADYLDRIDENGKLNNEAYPLILVPYSSHLPQEVLDKLSTLKTKVLFVTDEPCKTVKGFEAVCLNDLPCLLTGQGLRDISSECDNKFLRYYHCVRNGAQFYMLSNEDTACTINTTLKLSAFAGGDYIEYDAFENTAVRRNSKNGDVSICLPPYNSVVLIFGEVSFDGVDADKEKVFVSEEKLNISFDISIAKENDKDFRYYKTTDKLSSLTGKDGLPHFSGHAKYKGSFSVKKESGYVLDLGNVGEIAELDINGKALGVKLIPPYVFDISSAVRPGSNEITVTTTSHSGYEKRDGFSRYMLFEPSGLLGPITLKSYKNNR